MPSSSRRDFLRAAGSVPLIGTALAPAPYQPKKVAALKGSVKSVVIPTHEFAGDLEERLEPFGRQGPQRRGSPRAGQPRAGGPHRSLRYK